MSAVTPAPILKKVSPSPGLYFKPSPNSCLSSHKGVIIIQRKSRRHFRILRNTENVAIPLHYLMPPWFKYYLLRLINSYGQNSFNFYLCTSKKKL